MESCAVPVLLGILLCLLGRSNMKGNIASIHWYHRRRVSDADKPAFGRMVGLGTILAGASIIIMGLFSLAAEKTQCSAFTLIGSVISIAGIAACLVLSFRAMIKYNKGIF